MKDLNAFVTLAEKNGSCKKLSEKIAFQTERIDVGTPAPSQANGANAS
ncbi:MAG TPA: hypothetical protein PKY59_00340 [Pyrinomonadaceae bacterium]|nr:hypothetical protein [Pyrinomonadaceae bacterium]